MLSRGFIEHFDDPRRIIDLHMNLLRPGGTLIVSIPNFSGINRGLMAFFHRENLDIHNLPIMHPARFRELFAGKQLDEKFCGGFGIFNFGLFNTKADSRRAHLLRVCRLLQVGLNALFFLLPFKTLWESRWTSPYLLYIGVKKEPACVELADAA